jgi:hypothetical protein
MVGRAAQVRITGVDIYDIRIPVSQDETEAGVNNSFNIVEISTGAGVKGYSFAGPGVAELPAVRQLLVGRDLFAIEQLLADGLGRWGGVEHALWDAVGRIAKQPVYRLLGGASDSVKAYITCVWKGKPDQQHVSYREQAEQALRLQKAGFKGMKIRAWRPNPLDDADACREIRAATGPGFAVMFDRTAHAPESVGQKIWDFETGLKMARALERAGATWLEEQPAPVPRSTAAPVSLLRSTWFANVCFFVSRSVSALSCRRNSSRLRTVRNNSRPSAPPCSAPGNGATQGWRSKRHSYIGASLLPSTSPEKARVIGMLVDCRLAVPNRSHSVRAALGTNCNSSPIL